MKHYAIPTNAKTVNTFTIQCHSIACRTKLISDLKLSIMEFNSIGVATIEVDRAVVAYARHHEAVYSINGKRVCDASSSPKDLQKQNKED